VSRERIGALVLHSCPAQARLARGPEMLSVLLEAGGTSRVAFARECGSLVVGGLRERAVVGVRRVLVLPRLSARASLALSLFAAVSVAACGGSNGPSPAPSGPVGQSPKTAVADAYRFSVCMRSHGVENFPDPQVSSSGGHQSINISLSPGVADSPAFNSARTACGHLVPGANSGPSASQQQAQTQDLVAFAECMRKHGFARFPDPNNQGQLSPTQIQSAGINLRAPAVQPAADACTSVTHGLLTKADVAQAIANGSGSQAQPAPQSAP
jgi:hypothetical protein